MMRTMAEAPAPVYESWDDFLAKTTHQEQMMGAAVGRGTSSMGFKMTSSQEMMRPNIG